MADQHYPVSDRDDFVHPVVSTLSLTIFFKECFLQMILGCSEVHMTTWFSMPNRLTQQLLKAPPVYMDQIRSTEALQVSLTISDWVADFTRKIECMRLS